MRSTLQDFQGTVYFPEFTGRQIDFRVKNQIRLDKHIQKVEYQLSNLSMVQTKSLTQNIPLVYPGDFFLEESVVQIFLEKMNASEYS